MTESADWQFRNQAIAFRLDQIAYLSVLCVVFFIPFAKGAIEASISIGALAWFSSRLLNKNFDLLKIPLAVPLLIYCLLVILSTLHNSPIMLAAKGLLRTFKYAILYLMVAGTIRTEKRFQVLIRTLIIVALLSCANGALQKLTGWDYKHQMSLFTINGISRISGSFNHPNNFAAFLIVIILIAFYLRDLWKWSILRWISLPIYYYTLIHTRSRTPIFLLAVALPLLAVFFKKYRWRSLLIAAVIFAISIAYCFHDRLYFERLTRIFTSDARMQYWKVSVSLIKEHPVLGWGTNTFMYHFEKSPMITHYGENRFLYAHNFILQMWVEIGLVGLAAFLSLLWQFFLKAINYLKKETNETLKQTGFGIVAGLAIFLLHSTVDNNLQSLQLITFFWVMVGSLMGLASSSKKMS